MKYEKRKIIEEKYKPQEDEGINEIEITFDKVVIKINGKRI